MLVILFSCKDNHNGHDNIDVPLNNIHVNVLSWDKDLSQVDELYHMDGEKYTGDLNNKSKASRIKASVQLQDGLLHGLFTEIYPDGQPRTEKQFQYGYEEGLQKGWHSSGKISYNYKAKAGIRNGLYQEYYPDGKLQVESYYENGKEIKRKVKDIEGDIIVNYEIKDGRYYGLLGSASCISVLEDENYIKAYEK
jgi:hypothetical protein